MATAVICEFNPFHNGHKYLLESAKNVLKEPYEQESAQRFFII